MDIKKHTTPDKLEKYSFLWSEARLVIAAIALFIGGIPPILKITPSVFLGTVGSLLTLAWIISGIASAYLLYSWNANGRTLFGNRDMKDTTAFLISVVSGLNLGIVGILGTNVGMSISSSYALFVIVGILYLISGGYLYKRWNESGKTLFSSTITTVENL